MTQQRSIEEINREAMVNILEWLGDGRFIEYNSGDTYIDIVKAFDRAKPNAALNEALEDFLMWINEGDRLRRNGPDNPYGENIEFYCGDYSYGYDAEKFRSRAHVAAEEMVRLYEEGK